MLDLKRDEPVGEVNEKPGTAKEKARARAAKKSEFEETKKNLEIALDAYLIEKDDEKIPDGMEMSNKQQAREEKKKALLRAGKKQSSLPEEEEKSLLEDLSDD